MKIIFRTRFSKKEHVEANFFFYSNLWIYIISWSASEWKIEPITWETLKNFARSIDATIRIEQHRDRKAHTERIYDQLRETYPP